MTQFLTVFVVVATVLGVLYVLWRPHWTFVVVIAMFPFEQLMTVYIPLFRAKSWIFNVMVGFLALFAVMTRAARRDPLTSAYVNPVSVLIWLLYALWYVGFLYTLDPEEAWTRIVENTPYIGLLLVLMPLLIVDIHEFRRMTTGLMVLGSAIAILIIANPRSSYYSGRLTLDLGMIAGGASSRGSALALGELGGAIALAAALIRPVAINPMYTAIRITAFVSGFGLAIGSGSRGQVLAAGIAGVLFFPMSRRLANPKQFLFNCAGFGILLFGIYMAFKLFVGDENRERWDVWQMVQDTMLRMDMVGELFGAYMARPSYWLFGLGTQAFPAISSVQHADYVHNVAAEILCQHGLVGFIIYLSMIYLLVKNAYRLWLIYSDDPAMRSTVAVLLAICFYGLLLSLKQGSICYPAPFYWWMVLAKLSFHEQKAWAEAGYSLSDFTARRGSNASQDVPIDEELALDYGRGG